MTLHTPRPADIAALLPRLRRFARALTAHPEDADDLVQAALERAMNRSELWQPGTRVDSWLLRVVRHAWLDDLRSHPRRDAPCAEQGAIRPGEDAAARARQLAVQKALSQLPDDDRCVLGLVLVDGLPYKEAAAVLEIPVAALTSRLARARAALQGLLSDQARNMA